MEKDFLETTMLLKIIADFPNSLKKPRTFLSRVKACMTETEQQALCRICEEDKLTATLLPIKSVGVQGDCRTYSYVVGLSTDNKKINWDNEMTVTRLITKVCHNVNRVVHIFGDRVKDALTDITPTLLTQSVLATLRAVDDIAYTVLKDSGHIRKISQMPVILTPLHFDREPMAHLPSCQRSVVLRPFVTSDFMTGVAAIPGKHIPESVILQIVDQMKTVPTISRIMYDLTSKPPGTTEWE